MQVRDHVRAGLIALALVAHGIYALPIPSAVSEEQVAEPWRQRDIVLWQDVLGSVGIDVEKATLEQGLIDVTGAAHRFHQLLKTPFKPVFRFTGSNQAWGLFASATTRPDRLVIEVRREGQPDWHMIARRLDPCCTWYADHIRYRRIRGIWDGQKDKARPAYRNLTKWLARRAFAEFEDVDQVRFRLERGRSTYPWKPPDDEREYRLVRVHYRDRLR
ncbi:MAG: hypothetical protein KTR31_08675 [Myxococcales bacterium]|nr:hypothetical protein [Myxococcales bacterium]